MLFLPWTGTNLVLMPVLVPLSWWLWVRRKRPQLVFFLWVVTAGNYLVGTALKFFFERPRPSIFAQRGEFTGARNPRQMQFALRFMF